MSWIFIVILSILAGILLYCIMFKKGKELFSEDGGVCPMDAHWNGDHDSLEVKDTSLEDAVKHRSATCNPQELQKIPYIIHQTHEKDKIPVSMREAMETILSVNQEYEYRYYNSEDRRNFIRENFGDRGIKAYDKLLPGAYKADLFRYCVLYVSGGVYLDSGFVELVPLRKIILPDEQFLSATDRYEGRVGIYNAFMCVVPQSPILREVINICFTRIENEDYGETPLSTTGPLALAEAFEHVTGKKVTEGKIAPGVRLLRFHSTKGCISGTIWDNEDAVFYTKYPNYRTDAKWYTPDAPYYWNMWVSRKVFAQKS
jgi:mannosyltransferase OCH1-like enzyme